LDEDVYLFAEREKEKEKDKDHNTYLLPDGNSIEINPLLLEEASEILF